MQRMLEGRLILNRFLLFVTVQRRVAASVRFVVLCWSEQRRRVTSSTPSRGASASRRESRNDVQRRSVRTDALLRFPGRWANVTE
jgi:hypothetical protein